MRHTRALAILQEHVSDLYRMTADRRKLIKEYETEIASTNFQPRIDILQGRIEGFQQDIIWYTKEATELQESMSSLYFENVGAR